MRRTSMTGWWLSVALWVLGCGLALSAAAAQADELDEEALKRISYDVQFLASDELAGRGVGSPGIETAAKYVIDEYKKIGLKSGVADGSFRQPFKVNIGRQLVSNSFALKFTGPQGLEIVGEAGKNGQPMMVGGTADLTADLVFVGYGINAAEHNYNEYAAVDVKGKVVVLIRLEPQQNSDQSVFDGTTASNYARVRTKIATAAEAGAAGIILVNDGATADSDEKDELMQPDGFGRTGDTPFVQVKRSVIDEMLRVSPIPNPNGGNFDTLAKIEAYLDEKLEPVSAPIDEWKVHYQANFESVDADAYNLVGVLEGEGPLAKEYVVIGGHYDHLGFGEVGSRAPDRREIHNGADDNATGTAAVLELARRFARYDQKPKRTMVFICFSAEERGLLGSAFYVNEEKPLFDLAQTAAMINYDMIGWLREDKLTVFGTGSGSNFGDLLDKAAAGSDLKLDRVDSPFAGSDHMPFFQKGVPVMFLHTGLTDTYHTPEDDFQTLNMSGALRVIDFSEKMIWDLVNRDERPQLASEGAGAGGRASYLGVRFDFASAESGLRVVSVTPDSPAAQAGLATDDLVLEIAGTKVSQRSELAKILRDNKPGSKIKIKLTRGEETKEIEVELGEPAGGGR